MEEFCTSNGGEWRLEQIRAAGGSSHGHEEEAAWCRTIKLRDWMEDVSPKLGEALASTYGLP